MDTEWINIRSVHYLSMDYPLLGSYHLLRGSYDDPLSSCQVRGALRGWPMIFPVRRTAGCQAFWVFLRRDKRVEQWEITANMCLWTHASTVNMCLQ